MVGSIVGWLGLAGGAFANPTPPKLPSTWLAQSQASEAANSQETSQQTDSTRRLAVNLVQKGIEQARQENYSQAIATLRSATEAIPDWAGAHYNLGVALGLSGELQAAIDSYTRAIELNDKLVEAYVNRGLAKARQGNLSAAIDNYDRAIELDSDRVLAYYNRGVAKAGLADRNSQNVEQLWQEAIDDYSEAIQRDTTLVDAYLNRGFAYFQQQEYVDAIADYTSVIFRNPKSIDAYYNRGLTYLEMGWRQEAIADFRKASQLALDANQRSRYRKFIQLLQSLAIPSRS
jgi:tetratricopeptide (TPR) repeat protein